MDDDTSATLPIARTGHRPRAASVALAVAVIVTGIVMLQSCQSQSKAKATTYRQFGTQTTAEQTQTLDDLLSAHNLKTADVGNQLGLQQHVIDYCGLYGKAATQNLDQAIDASVDWSKGTW
jgi:hypothetical protein